jgi:hypothetical protein
MWIKQVIKGRLDFVECLCNTGVGFTSQDSYNLWILLKESFGGKLSHNIAQELLSMSYQGCLKFMSSLSWSDWRKSQNSIEDVNGIWVAVPIFFRILLLVEDFVDSFLR